jgi:hypothetical protein
MNNYRPISLLTSISKILETIMFERLDQHSESNKLFTSVQFGFRKDVHKQIRLIKMCLTETYSRVRVGKNLSDMFHIRNGLKLGDALSHCFSTLR